MRSNCLLFVLGRWWGRGGYIIIRRSRWGPFPHFLWSPDLSRFESFVPANPQHRLCPPCMFVGYIKEGDD